VSDSKSGGTPRQRDVEDDIALQRAKLESLVGSKVDVMSFHDPEATGLTDMTASTLAGMLNVYGGAFRSRYAYCSDSNGYWRFTPLSEVLVRQTPEPLHVLTHPVWWTPTPMAPRARIERCVLGRSRAVMKDYDEFLLSQKKCRITRDNDRKKDLRSTDARYHF
jgi:hypothetical protein